MRNYKLQITNYKQITNLKLKFDFRFVVFVSIIIAFVIGYTPDAHATSLNPFSEDFRLAICDGPAELNTEAAHQIKNPNYNKKKDDDTIDTQLYIKDPSWNKVPDDQFIACDIVGAMKQVQHIIDAMIILGALLAVGGLTYAGYLYMTGEEGKIKQAKGMFRKILTGFIIMLSAWFIVWQILDWVGASDVSKALLGNGQPISNPIVSP